MNGTMKTSGKRQIVSYWIITGLLCLVMFAGGLSQFLQSKWQQEGMIQLGYPLYVNKILGVWKMLGVIALLIPGISIWKEWAYAGFTFILTGALMSHLAVGNGADKLIAPLILLVFTFVSWKTRSGVRK